MLVYVICVACMLLEGVEDYARANKTAFSLVVGFASIFWVAS